MIQKLPLQGFSWDCWWDLLYINLCLEPGHGWLLLVIIDFVRACIDIIFILLSERLNPSDKRKKFVSSLVILIFLPNGASHDNMLLHMKL